MRNRVSYFKNNKAAFECQWKLLTTIIVGISGSKVRHWAGELTWENTGIHKSHRDLFIYFQTSFHSAGGSSVPSVGALGSRKSGCCSSFRYLGGVRMWVEPTGDKSLKAQQGLNPGWKLVYYIRYTLKWSWKKMIEVLLKSYKTLPNKAERSVWLQAKWNLNCTFTCSLLHSIHNIHSLSVTTTYQLSERLWLMPFHRNQALLNQL